jgi:LPS sulfotransferase NodH
LSDDGQVLAAPYWSKVVANRTNQGIFGVKIVREQLMLFTQRKIEAAKIFLRDFDRFIVLQPQDRILQAISVARATFDEGAKGMPDDSVVFPRVAACLRNILEDEANIDEMIEGIDPGRIRRVDDGDLPNNKALEATAGWLWQAAGVEQPAKPRPEATLDVPRKIDEGERALKQRFLARIGAY